MESALAELRRMQEEWQADQDATDFSLTAPTTNEGQALSFLFAGKCLACDRDYAPPGRKKNNSQTKPTLAYSKSSGAAPLVPIRTVATAGPQKKNELNYYERRTRLELLLL